MATDPYKTLGVTANASQDEIKNAYRRLAKKSHPDLNPGNKEAEKTFKDLSLAYELIGTEDARKKYEQDQRSQAEEAAQHARQTQNRGYYHQTQNEAAGGRYSQGFEGTNFDSDLFESLFRQSPGGQKGARGGAGAPNDGHSRGDETYQMSIHPPDALRGAHKEISLPSGKRLSVKIPAGIASGTRLRFAGQAAAGDAYVQIQVESDTQFRVEGDNLESDLPVSFEDAILGAEVRASTAEGTILLKVPKAVDSDRRIRVPGKGLVNRATRQRGDLIFVVKLRMPKTITPELEAAARSMKEGPSPENRPPKDAQGRAS